MANKGYEKVEVISNIEISKDIYKIKVKLKTIARSGQFYMIRCFEDTNMLSRPISICDKDENTLTFLYAVVGKGTNILKTKRKKDFIEILGPLGNGFEVFNKDKKVAVIAGGIGIAPMLSLCKDIKGEIDLYAGFKDEIYFLDEFKKIVKNIYISTNTGRHGHKGLITEIIKDEYDSIYVCGPSLMMKKIQELNLKSKVFFSLEARMGCGIGACLSCSCKTKEKMKRICKEGPVFNSREVVF